MQCRWDTTRHGAVWVPDDCAMDNIKCQLDLDDTSKKIDLADPAVVEAIDKAERDYCKSVLNEYNAWLAGDCHGAVVYVINRETGRRLKSQDEECWGFIGETYAKEHLEDEMIGVAQRLIDKGLDDLSAINIH